MEPVGTGSGSGSHFCGTANRRVPAGTDTGYPVSEPEPAVPGPVPKYEEPVQPVPVPARGSDSPIIFLIVTGNLHILMDEAVKTGFFKGIKVGKYEDQISHLQYVDDVVFFQEMGFSKTLKILLKKLRYFQLIVGLKINVGKSQIYGVRIREEEVQASANSIRREKTCHGSKNLSVGGQLTLVKSVLGSLAIVFFLVVSGLKRCGLSVGEKEKREVGWGYDNEIVCFSRQDIVDIWSKFVDKMVPLKKLYLHLGVSN
ncbi:hypothetical protein OSB04_008153 [Centaurea solstitialis]|uniref:Reverse transcriptase domain-containing protein n=1 Tax=Centaurea solstitialis TaxID=347529 RepID=A0AA38TL82_9ASTR|nr:hypothetical protein OSB04_008153 [Centaurea solstitialis]